MKKIILLSCIMAIIPLVASCGLNQSAENKTITNPKEYFANFAAKKATLSGLSYEMSYNMAGQQMVAKHWIEGSKMKMETDFQGNKSLMIFENGKMTIYNPSTGIAMVMNKVDNQEEKYNPEKIEPETITLLEKTSVNGYSCQMMQVGDINTKETFKMCMSEEYGMPIYMEVKSPEGEVKIEYKNIKAGKLPPDTFKLPAGVQVMKMPGMQ